MCFFLFWGGGSANQISDQFQNGYLDILMGTSSWAKWQKWERQSRLAGEKINGLLAVIPIWIGEGRGWRTCYFCFLYIYKDEISLYLSQKDEISRFWNIAGHQVNVFFPSFWYKIEAVQTCPTMSFHLESPISIWRMTLDKEPGSLAP